MGIEFDIEEKFDIEKEFDVEIEFDIGIEFDIEKKLFEELFDFRYWKGTIWFWKRIWYRGRAHHKSVRNEWPQWASVESH